MLVVVACAFVPCTCSCLSVCVFIEKQCWFVCLVYSMCYLCECLFNVLLLAALIVLLWFVFCCLCVCFVLLLFVFCVFVASCCAVFVLFVVVLLACVFLFQLYNRVVFVVVCWILCLLCCCCVLFAKS